MKANEFVKRFGWGNSKECLRILRLRDTDFPFVCVCGDCTERDDLERLVESHELVESCGGLQSVKDTFNFAWSHGADELTEYGERLKQAIADVESCHVD